ncbi:MAG: DUF2089 domain-containing protein [Candidatus Latescibacterota bacterium]
MRKILERCPACGGDLDVTQLTCPACDTVVQGAFSPCPFCRLAPDSLHFLTVFVRNRGNLKEMERELGQSYPTLRNRLHGVLRELGFEVRGSEEPESGPGEQRREVLARLERGELTADEAVQLLSALR